MKIYRGGRPRQERPQIDLGTPELRMKKLEYGVGPNESATPLQRLLNQKDITQEEFNAANHFRNLRSAIWGNGCPVALDPLRVSGSRDSVAEEVEADRYDSYSMACRKLGAAGLWERYEFEHIVFDEQTPVWMLPNQNNSGRNRFKRALAAVLDWHKTELDDLRKEKRAA